MDQNQEGQDRTGRLAGKTNFCHERRQDGQVCCPEKMLIQQKGKGMLERQDEKGKT